MMSDREFLIGKLREVAPHMFRDAQTLEQAVAKPKKSEKVKVKSKSQKKKKR